MLLLGILFALLQLAQTSELSRCCSGGARHYRESNTCLGIRSEGTSITCTRSASICCLRALLDRTCTHGVRMAKKQQFCSMNGGGIERECCDCCLLAKDLRAENEPCIAPKGFSSVCLASFNDCCNTTSAGFNSQESSGLTSPSDIDTNDAIGSDADGTTCEKAECEHICSDRGNGIAECSCRPGYELDSNGKDCLGESSSLSSPADMTFSDECSEHPCNPKLVCVNTENSHYCRPDYRMRVFNPAELKELFAPGKKGAAARAAMECDPGFITEANGSCTDVDECNLGSHDCGPLYHCRNTQGSYRCDPKRCNESDIMNPVTGECTSINCPFGYTAKNGTCQDIDECANPKACTAYEDCINSPGSYRCQEKGNICSFGYKLDTETGFCNDVDECASSELNNCGDMVCINLFGSYKCRCLPGFEFNEETKTCEDVDECVKFAGHTCGMYATCENTVGSFRCRCHEGYNESSDGRHCNDIDECELGIAKCQQKCVNTPGSYQCICDRGYMLAMDDTKCIDVDECSIWARSGSQLCMGSCINTPGSFRCTCPPGYQIQDDGITCKDIDECSTGVCTEKNHICVNTLGSYRCEKIVCPANYVHDKNYKNRCVKSSKMCTNIADSICKHYPAHITWQHIAIPKHINISAHRTSVTLITMKGPSNPATNVLFELRVVKSKPETFNVIPAIRSNFLIQKGDTPNSAMISLRDSLDGPQEVHLELVLQLYTNNVFTSKYIANIIVYVSQYRPPPPQRTYHLTKFLVI